MTPSTTGTRAGAAAGSAADDRSTPDVWTVIVRMAGRFRPYRLQLAAALTMVGCTVVLNVASPLLLRRLIDDVLPRHDSGATGRICGVLIVLGLLGSVIGVGETALTNWIGQRVTFGLRMDLYDRARAQAVDFYGEEGTTEIQTRLASDIDGVARFLTNTAQDALAAAGMLVAATAAMAVVSLPLAAASFCIAFFLGLLNNRFAQRRRVLAVRRQRQLGGLLRYAAEDLSLGGILLGRTLGRTSAQRARFAAEARLLRDTTFRQVVVGSVAFTVIRAVFATLPPAVYWLSGTVMTNMSVGDVVVLVILQMRLTGPIQRLLGLSAGLQASVAMFGRVLEYVDLDDEVDLTPVDRTDGDARLRLTAVSHAYPASPRAVLDDVDLDLPDGSVTLVVGPTGSGKSTLGLVLAGLIEPDAGTVRIGGHPDTGPRLREAVTLVTQHTTLLRGSIRENLLFARPDAGEPELAGALRAARIDELVALLPDGLDTQVGQDGYQLSGGERQRLALARALLTDFRVLVVDEATSGLDAVTAQQVHDSLRAWCRDRTLVVVTHRIPAPAATDRIVVMERGRIAECGSHAELRGRGGGYAAQVEAQSRTAAALSGLGAA